MPNRPVVSPRFHDLFGKVLYTQKPGGKTKQNKYKNFLRQKEVA